MPTSKRLLRELPNGAVVRLLPGSKAKFVKESSTTIAPTAETKRKFKSYRLVIRLHLSPGAYVLVADPKYWK